MNYKQQNQNTIWIGNLDGFEDEKYFQTIFSPFYKLQSIKIIKNNLKTDYVFLELNNYEEAQQLINQFNNQQRPLSQKYFQKDYFESIGHKKIKINLIQILVYIQEIQILQLQSSNFFKFLKINIVVLLRHELLYNLQILKKINVMVLFILKILKKLQWQLKK